MNQQLCSLDELAAHCSLETEVIGRPGELRVRFRAVHHRAAAGE